MIELNWLLFKKFVNDRDISIQYIELPTQYTLRAFDGYFYVESKLIKGSLDSSDFEDHYKNLPKTNKPVIQRVSLTLADDKLSLCTDAIAFSATANQTSIYDYKFTQSYLVRGVTFFSNDATLGDYIIVQLVDKDGILGQGSNYVIKTIVNKAYVSSTNNSGPLKFEDISAAELPIPNLYLRISYTNTSLLNIAHIYANLILYIRD